MQYSFTLKDNNQKAYRSFIWFLLFLHIVAASIIGSNSVDPHVKFSLYFLTATFVVVSVIYFFFRKKEKALDFYSFFMAILYANFWLEHSGEMELIIFLAVYLFAVTIRLRKTNILFSEEGVHLNRIFIPIIYSWQKLDNVILKDNLLTIDLKSNKLIQVEITEAGVKTDELLFNRFCTEQLQNKS